MSNFSTFLKDLEIAAKKTKVAYSFTVANSGDTHNLCKLVFTTPPLFFDSEIINTTGSFIKSNLTLIYIDNLNYIIDDHTLTSAEYGKTGLASVKTCQIKSLKIFVEGISLLSTDYFALLIQPPKYPIPLQSMGEWGEYDIELILTCLNQNPILEVCTDLQKFDKFQQLTELLQKTLNNMSNIYSMESTGCQAIIRATTNDIGVLCPVKLKLRECYDLILN